MVKAGKLPIYSAADQKRIHKEVEVKIAAVIAAAHEQYPGLALPWTLQLVAVCEPLIAEHSGQTRPLAPRDAMVKAPE